MPDKTLNPVDLQLRGFHQTRHQQGRFFYPEYTREDAHILGKYGWK